MADDSKSPTVKNDVDSENVEESHSIDVFLNGSARMLESYSSSLLSSIADFEKVHKFII
tara:strand:- start:1513 stop:1689 length:177 start_codon:yes stop_codon:yes gene_type:complete